MAVANQYRAALQGLSRGLRGTWTTTPVGTGIGGTKLLYGDLHPGMWQDLPVAKGAYAAYESIWKQLNLDPAPTGILYNRGFTFTATGTLVASRQMIFGVVRPFAATGTLAVNKWIAKGVSFTATGTLTLQRLISVSKAFAATGSLVATKAKSFFVTASMAATGTLVVAKRLSMGVARSFSAVGTLVTGQSFIPGAIGPAILAEYVRRFFTYLGRRW